MEAPDMNVHIHSDQTLLCHMERIACALECLVAVIEVSATSDPAVTDAIQRIKASNQNLKSAVASNPVPKD